MKKLTKIVFGLTIVFIMSGCITTKTAVSENTDAAKKKEISSAKRPEIIDHKNQKWGKEPPEWVELEISEIEEMPRYKGKSRVFKFESEKSKDLEGAQLWLKNFTANSEIAREIDVKIKNAASAAGVGNTDSVAKYLQEVTSSISKAKLNGLKKESDYWVLQRYFTHKGDVEGDYYTVLILYSYPEEEFTKLIDRARAGIPAPKTEEEKKARDLADMAISEALFSE